MDQILEKQITVRAFTESDRAGLATLYSVVKTQTFTWLSAEQISADSFDRDTAGEQMLVAEVDGQLAGFISLWEPDAFIHHLYVYRQYQGRGIGQLLINAIRRDLKRPLTLKCLEKNEKAARFYLSHGWKKLRDGTSGQGSYLLLQLCE